MKKVVNLTPHTLVCNGISIPSAGIARAAETSTKVGEIATETGNIPVYRMEFGAPVGLPEPQSDTICVVSSLTAAAVKQFFPDRTDIYVPGKQLRDETGKIVGCEGLAIY